jgi:hypothetical protein
MGYCTPYSNSDLRLSPAVLPRRRLRVAHRMLTYDRPVLGNLDARKKLLEVYVLLPTSHVTRLTAIASSDRIKGIRVMATKTIRRKALVRSIHIFTELGLG